MGGYKPTNLGVAANCWRLFPFWLPVLSFSTDGSILRIVCLAVEGVIGRRSLFLLKGEARTGSSYALSMDLRSPQESWTSKRGYGEGGLSLVKPLIRPYGLILGFSWAYPGIAPPPHSPPEDSI